MEILILSIQYASLTASLTVLCLVLVALPFAVGRAVGKREAADIMVDRAMSDDVAFQVWLTGRKIEKSRKSIAALN